MKATSILLLVLTVTLVLPLGFSGVRAEDQSHDANQTSSNDNKTSTMEDTNETNIGQQVSDFVHNATALFKQQKAENLEAIKACHDKLQNATSENREAIKDECHSTLVAIREKYQDMRDKFQDLFKQFRENIITLRHKAEGLEVSDNEKSEAIKRIHDDAVRHGIKSLNMTKGHFKWMEEHDKKGIEQAMHHANETSSNGNQSMTVHKGESHDEMHKSEGQSAMHEKH